MPFQPKGSPPRIFYGTVFAGITLIRQLFKDKRRLGKRQKTRETKEKLLIIL